MTQGWRHVVRTMATAAAAAAMTRAAESVRRFLDEASRPELGRPTVTPGPPQFFEPSGRRATAGPLATTASVNHVIAAQADRPHDYGPTPVVAPSRGIGFRSEPPRPAEPAAPTAEMPVISRPMGAEPDEPEAVVVDEPVHTAAAIVHGLDDEDETPDHAAEDEPAQDADEATVTTLPATPTPVETTETTRGRHRRQHGAISGTVRSSRGRGLRGLRVTAYDEDKKVVATGVTGAGGAFVVEDLPAGHYRLRAKDAEDADFAKAWHDGPSFAGAKALKVKHDKTRRGTDLTVLSKPLIEAEVERADQDVIVTIRVTDRATGAPAKGRVRLSTRVFGTELPLRKGRVTLTLFGPADGSATSLGKKLAIDYLGAKHTRAGSHVARLR